ncbi:MAG: glycosyltransferase family 2 protein [Bellilinea sp.]
MDSRPLVSIVTPSYNQAAYLETTMQSVLEQGYPYVEYLIADGGSTDGSADIIQGYSSRLAWWVSEKDQGQADGANKGFRRARGEIVGWLNSDDVYRPGAIAGAVAAFQANPQAGLVFSDVDSLDGAGNLINIMRFGPRTLEDLMAFKIISQPSVFMRRSLLEQVGYLDSSYHLLLDHHLWLRMALFAPLAYVPGARWASARFHAAAKNVAQAGAFGSEAYRLAEWLSTAPEYQTLMARNRKKVWAGAHRLNAFYLLDGGQPGAALKSYWKGFWCQPVAVLPDWYRIIYAFLNPLGLAGLRRAYLLRRAARMQRKEE